jgi:hypothetical protein
VSVQEIEVAVKKLSRKDFAEFRRWFAEHDWQLWDEQIERDSQAGKLDGLAHEALEELRSGKCRDL